MEEKIEALQTALEYMRTLYSAVKSCAEKLHDGNVPEAYGQIGLISEGLDWLVNILVLTQGVHQIDPIILKNIMSELVEAFENEDTMLIADLLEYEIGDKLEEWYENLERVLQEIE